MNRTTIVGICLVGCAAFLLITIAGLWVSAHNREVSLRALGEAQQTNIEQQLDAMLKKISQSAQVTTAQAEALRGVILDYARNRGGSSGSLATSLKEAVPDLSPTTPAFTTLQNIIVGSRNTFATEQSRLIDIKREHDTLLQRFPSSIFVGGRKPLEIRIVSSTRAKSAVATGVDDDDSVFKPAAERR